MRQRGISGIGRNLLLAAVLAAGTVNLSAYKSPSPHGSHSYGKRGGDSFVSTLFGPSVPPVADYLARVEPPALQLSPANPRDGAVPLSETAPFIEPRPTLEGFLAYLESERTAALDEEEGSEERDEREENDLAATGTETDKDQKGGQGTTADGEELSESMLAERAEVLRIETASRPLSRLFPAPNRTRIERDWLQVYFPINDGSEGQRGIIVPVPYNSNFLPPGQEGMRSRATFRQEP